MKAPGTENQAVLLFDFELSCLKSNQIKSLEIPREVFISSESKFAVLIEADCSSHI